MGTLPLLAVCVGIVLGATYATNYSYTTLRAKAIKNGKLVPEDRLPPMIVGSVWLTIGLFWFAWTSSPSITPWPQILSGVPLGFGIQVISLQSLAYLIDIYLTSANSAISGTVIVRSLVGGLFPLFAPLLYTKLQVSSVIHLKSTKSNTNFIMTGLLGNDSAWMRRFVDDSDTDCLLYLWCSH